MRFRHPMASLVVGIVVVMGIAAIPASVSAADQWPDYCHEAETVSPGSYSGQVGPNDLDWFALDLKDGEYISATVEIEATGRERVSVLGADRFIVNEDTGHHTQSELEDMGFVVRTNSVEYNHGKRAVSFVYEESEIADDRGFNYGIYSESKDVYQNQHEMGGVTIPTGKYEFQAHSVTNHVVCLGILMHGGEGSATWKLAFEKNTGNAPDIGESGDGGESGDVAELRETIEQKNQRITELEQQVEDLQAQLEAQQGGDGITINVEVSPGGGQQSFVEGEPAMVEAESTNADLSQVEVQYAGNTYSLDSTGQAAIPITSSGQQELVFSYAGASESVMLDVQAVNTDSVDDDRRTSATPGGIIPVAGPGFGAPVALVAILLAGLLAKRIQG